MRQGGKKLIFETVRRFSFQPRLLLSLQRLAPLGYIVGHATHNRTLNSLGTECVVVFPQPGFAPSGLSPHYPARKSFFPDFSEVAVKLLAVFRQQSLADVQADQRLLPVAQDLGCPGIN